MFKRHCTKRILEALKDTRVVLIAGARQVGKTTLAKDIMRNSDAEYFSMDNATVFSTATSDPTSFINKVSGRVVIDEVQRVPELLLAIKQEVDQNPKPGRFLLTGSANILTLPRVSDSLAGRMETINLWPLSCGELLGKKESFLERCFANDFKHAYQFDLNLLRNKILLGGYPEVQSRTPGARCTAWFQNYLTSIIDRDIKDLSMINGITDIPKLLVLLAARAGSLINLSDISRLSGMPWTTLKRYISLLESIYLIRFVQSWSSNLSKHVTKQPKLYFADTGLLCHLYNINSVNRLMSHTYFGHIVENFVFQELVKQISWYDEVIRIYTFRGERDMEVDLVLEKQGGEIVGVEVKSSATVDAHDFAGLRLLADTAKTQFKAGYVLYTGTARVPFGDKLTALPMYALFE